ncbi:MAG: tRNA lysidine(34) synthetase TilS [Deltaproteobacteria bacterium]|nr:tRNA lysidine(34) synthetase TilS [Deltaproteobacteria bacterium]
MTISGPETTISIEGVGDRFRAALTRLIQPQRGEGLVVAFSGGADSTALLHLCHIVGQELGLRIIAAHLDHGLREFEAQRDREAAEARAGELKLPFYWEQVNCRELAHGQSLSLEEAAREARYAFLERVRVKANARYIATGHTADDNAEAVLFNIMRGTGPAGLAGIPPVREGRIIRPLLGFWKEELVSYLKIKNLTWVEDSSNTDLAYSRNRIRHSLLPQIEKHFNPAVKSALNRMIEIIREEESVWRVFLGRLKPEVDWAAGQNGVTMRICKLNDLHVAERRRLIREGFLVSGNQSPPLDSRRVDDILNLLTGGRDRGVDLPGRTRAWTGGGFLYIGPPPEKREVSFEYTLPVPGFVRLEEIGSGIEAEIDNDPRDINPRNLGPLKAVLDLDRIETPLTVRNFRPGDRFQPLGLKGTKKLHDFFIDSKIPAAGRKKIPLVLDRKGIIWAAGLRISERARFSAETKTVLLLSLKKP